MGQNPILPPTIDNIKFTPQLFKLLSPAPPSLPSIYNQTKCAEVAVNINFWRETSPLHLFAAQNMCPFPSPKDELP